MVPFFPKQIANKGFYLYLLSLTTVSLLFFDYAISWYYMVMGIVETSLFFLLASYLTKKWLVIKDTKRFLIKLFGVALLLRLIWVVFSYYFYLSQLGSPFEFDSADAIGYHDEAEWLAGEDWRTIMVYLFYDRLGYSDSGYPLYLTILYKVFGSNIIIPRLIKAVLSSLACVLVYKLIDRSMGEKIGRMAALFCAFMPNLYIYCGLHLKETEMIFLEIAFLERADYLYRSNKTKAWDILVPLFLCLSLFLFRTALGAVAALSFVTALVFTPTKVSAKTQRVRIALWLVLAVTVLGGSAIMNEVEEMIHNKDSNQKLQRMEQTSRGNRWAQYATGTVMAPMAFVVPFTTMVDTGQNNQLVLHGGNFVRNFMGVFVLLGLYSALFVKKKWRDFALIGSFTVFYLLVVALSAFANSERFLLPALPGLLIMAAYGISELNSKNYKWIKVWYVVVVLMQVGWAFFKLGSRGIVGG